MSDIAVPPSCARSRFSLFQRFALFFGVLFALKFALRHTPLPPAAQVVALVSVASALVWSLWAAGGASRRGPLVVIAVLWLAAVAKLALR